MRKISVPFVLQKNNYTCGNACIRMVCGYFGVRVTNKQVMQLCGVSVTDLKRHGLPNRKLFLCLRKLGINCSQKKNCTIVQLRRVAGMVPVVVAYSGRTAAWGHFAVVTGIDKNRLIFNDPISGSDFTLAISDFSRRWRSAYEKSNRWMCVAKELSVSNKNDTIIRTIDLLVTGI